MSTATPPVPVQDFTFRKRRSWMLWLTFALMIAAVALNFLVATINPMQRDLEQCNLNYELRRTPGNTLPEYSLDEFNRCADAGARASTYFFLTSLMILFNFAAIDGLMAGKVRALIAYGIGAAFVTAVSLIMGGGIPVAFLTVNIPVLLLLYLLVRRRELT